MYNLSFGQKIILTLLGSNKKKVMSPIQIMKALFVFNEEERPKNFYNFIPYLYGPCSFSVYKDLKKLNDLGLIHIIPSYREWNFYGITSKGEKYMLENNNIIKKIEKIKGMVLSKTFVELLKYIYTRYPESAKNSIVNNKILKNL